MTKGFKAVKITKSGDGWREWDAKGRAYGILELGIAEDAKSPDAASEGELKDDIELDGTYVVVPSASKVDETSPYHAKRRCNLATCVTVFDLEGKPISDAEPVCLRADQEWAFTYTIGESTGLTPQERVVYQKKKSFLDTSKPCGPGVHYFDSFEAAVKLATHWQRIHDE